MVVNIIHRWIIMVKRKSKQIKFDECFILGEDEQEKMAKVYRDLVSRYSMANNRYYRKYGKLNDKLLEMTEEANEKLRAVMQSISKKQKMQICM